MDMFIQDPGHKEIEPLFDIESLEAAYPFEKGQWIEATEQGQLLLVDENERMEYILDGDTESLFNVIAALLDGIDEENQDWLEFYEEYIAPCLEDVRSWPHA